MLKLKFRIPFLIFSFAFNFLVSGNDSDSAAQDLCNNARKYCLKQEWAKAKSIFQQVIDDYPSSRYHDDALFWIGYCLEKQGGQHIEAFLTYNRLIQKFPQSSWADDARMHQIELAEKYVNVDQKFYTEFLINNLASKNSDIQNQSAIALARLGDKRAIPILSNLKSDETLGAEALLLLKSLTGEKQPIQTPEAPRLESADQADLDIIRSKISESRDDEQQINKRSFLFFPTKRYEQYTRMLKSDDSWTKEELESFALWHILPTNEFDQFSSLDGYDRQEWFRKYWKERDPTPTTEENECLNEFYRRIEYVRENFSAAIDFKHSRYLRDQYLRTGWPKAPWDARGEIYIKYGEPDSWGIEGNVDGFNVRQWVYYRYNVDFNITEHVTNIYGGAIQPGFLSKQLHNTNPMYVEANFIYNPDFQYHHNYYADPIKDAKFGIDDNVNGKVSFSYSIPTKELNVVPQQDKFEISYIECYVIFNEDLREVKRHEIVRTVTKDSRKEFKKEKQIIQHLAEELSPGDYNMALKIEDKNSDKMGIFRIALNVNR